MDLRRRKWLETGEECIIRSFIICMLHQIFLELSRKMGIACSMHGRDEKSVKNC
jgi:hypothetical protein